MSGGPAGDRYGLVVALGFLGLLLMTAVMFAVSLIWGAGPGRMDGP